VPLNTMHTRRPAAARLVLLALVLAGAAGCAITLISPYDEQIDKTATALQLEMDTFLTSLVATPQPPYAEKRQFYTDYEVKLRSVLLRAQSHPKNQLTVQQIDLMMKNLGELQQAHEAGPMDPAMVATMRNLFNLGWQAIIKLELAKKRGET
jgi:hypothetical protein